MSTAKFDTLSTLDGSRSVPVNTVAQGSAKAWVNFNGTGTVAIRASFNVSSITDNGTGDYTVNFTNAMADANYATSVSSQFLDGGSGVTYSSMQSTSARTASATRVVSVSSSFVFTDSAIMNVAVFR
jgi:hypothetical protein